MPAIAVNPPFPLFTDADGQPLDDAYIYIGTANQNPVSNPITVYWDSALTIAAAQPIRTSGGYPIYNGTPARFYTNSDYSILVRDKNGAFIYTAASETDLISSEFVTFVQAGSGAVQRSMQSKARESVTAADFGAVGNGVLDDAAALNLALNSGASLVKIDGSYLIGTNVTVPNGVDLIGEQGTAITSSGAANFIVSGNNRVENIAFNLGNSARQIIGTAVSNVTFRNCSVTGSTNSGFYFDEGPDDLRFENCVAFDNGKYGFGIFGTEANAPNRITLTGCRAYGNDFDGINVSGVGQKTSPAQVANYATNVIISDCVTYSNGTSAFNGMTVPYCRYVTISNCITHSNAEHGIALQETFDFAISGLVSYSNGQAGICMQSGYDPFNPTARGVVSGAHCYNNSNEGLALKEKCQNIIFSGCAFINNAQFSVRLRDLGGSGLKSEVITFVGCAFTPSGGSGFSNANSSTAVTSSSTYNYAGVALQPNRTLTAALSSALTIDTRGTTFDYPEVFVLTNSGTQVSRTLIAQATLGRRITLIADGGGAVGVRHNQGDGVSYAGFLNSAAATVTLGAWKSITYLGNGTDWVEIAKNT